MTSGWLGLVLLSYLAPAQASGRHLRPASPPRELVRYELATGRITRSPTEERAAFEVNEFPNLDLLGYIGVDSGGGAMTWINDGVKGLADNSSDLLSSFVVAYCSTKLDPSLGGPGGTIRLGLYEGYTRGGATPSGTLVHTFTLTGLPAHSRDSSFYGGMSCYLLEVELSPMLPFADGPIGYSWEFADLGSDGILGGTFPFLSASSSCSAVAYDLGQAPYRCCSNRPADAYRADGTLDAVWTTFPYCYPFAIGIALKEAADVGATSAPFVGSGVNVDVLNASPPVVGAPWSAEVVLGHAHGSGGSVHLALRTSAFDGPTLVSPFGGRAIEPLTSGPLLATFVLAHDGSRSDPLSVPVPPSLALVGSSFAAQATVFGGGFVDLSSARVGVVGTQ